ncbi:hypothetical protein BO85DRAFT_198487 [Aspergillus piperis CBS 112811]|uniref:Uncharacterized protein n=1 Tax=Aspergillus piperis CBS 112811 TaxID=1448313 RepID=A0A8G1QU09_9EURO|nr:hypothetical protein BO85DRAFT_198487 [Aspergillus piperis CBS 112811]RAH52559.1 hypothetical protein BO85DRAFT_198487 [Aspergillus piperis CBS 112811]
MTLTYVCAAVHIHAAWCSIPTSRPIATWPGTVDVVFGAKVARRSGSLGPGVTQNLIQITASIRVRLSHTTVSSPHWKLEPKDDSRPDWSRLQLMLSRRAAIAPGGTAICEHVAGQSFDSFQLDSIQSASRARAFCNS